MMKEDLGVSNAQAWGCPCAPPINIQGDSSVYAWGCPHASPSSSTIISSSLVALYFYHFMRYVLCLERLALYFFLVCLALFPVVTSQTPTYSFVWDRNILHLN